MLYDFDSFYWKLFFDFIKSIFGTFVQSWVA